MRKFFTGLVLAQCFFLCILSCKKDEKKDSVFEVAGITESDARAFYSSMKDAIATGNKKALASMVSYPVGVTLKGKGIGIKNETEFIKNYDQIITIHIRDLVQKTTFEDLKPNFRGLFVGNGEIIFGGIGTPKQYRVLITVFNNQMK